MATIVTRAGKGSPLTNTEVDANFTNLNTDKAELSGATFTGEIVANAGIALGDNDKATFGTGDDLQCYHDGSHSIIADVGTGDLLLRGNNARLQNSDGSATFIHGFNAGAVDINYAGNTKLATTSTGIDVTGTATMDGLTVDGNTQVNSASASASGTRSIQFYRDSAERGAVRFDYSASAMELQADGSFFVSTGGEGTSFFINGSTRDISFYEDTGTTPKLFWDASAERLSFPTLSITDGSITTTAATGDHTVFNSTGADADFRVRTGANTHSLYVEGNTGSVGIGTSSVIGNLNLHGGTGDTATQDAVQTFTRISSTGNRLAAKIRLDNSSTAHADLKFQVKTIASSAESDSYYTDALTIQGSSGRVGIGTSSPITSLTLGTGTTGLSFKSAATSFNSGKIAVIKPVEDGSGNGHLVFETYKGGSGGGERMRIDSSGNLLVGTTSAGTQAAGGVAIAPSSDSLIRIGHANGTGSGALYMQFSYNQSVVGSISQNGTSQVLFNVSSDQRLKENIVDADDAGNKIDAIKVRQFDWKADGQHQDYGMVAQELQTVAPEAVSAPRDSEEMMGVDYSKLVPMLIKEIQSLRQRVASLEE